MYDDITFLVKLGSHVHGHTQESRSSISLSFLFLIFNLENKFVKTVSLIGRGELIKVKLHV